jgi:beta-carotene ketolase (CrtW type)
MTSLAPPTSNTPGVLIALAIMALWAATLIANLALLPWGKTLPWALSPLAVAVQTMLYTGLFITAHDAMHGVVAPTHRRLNDAIGATATGLYALFPFHVLRTAHHRHHAAPGTHDDPDFHDGKHPDFARWYLRFVFRYVRWQQIVGMALVFNILAHLAHIPQPRLIVFWVVPSLLSTLQLFYFGTYLPHRGHDHPDHHRARSNNYPVWLSLITCYHFGYHWEHHQWPYLPWWRLPLARHTQ